MLKVAEAAKLAGVPKTKIMRAIRSGLLPATQFDDGDYLIDASEIARLFGAPPLTRGAEARGGNRQNETLPAALDAASGVHVPSTRPVDPIRTVVRPDLSRSLAAIRAALLTLGANQLTTSHEPAVNPAEAAHSRTAYADAAPAPDEPALMAREEAFRPTVARGSKEHSNLLAIQIPLLTVPSAPTDDLAEAPKLDCPAVDIVSDDPRSATTNSHAVQHKPEVSAGDVTESTFVESIKDHLRTKPNELPPSIDDGRAQAKRSPIGSESSADELARRVVLSMTHQTEAIKRCVADAPVSPTADNSSANCETPVLAARIESLNVEIQGLRDLLAEVKASREELRQDRDDWRRRAELLLAHQRRPWWPGSAR
jgi:Helix-turn-helix domain